MKNLTADIVATMRHPVLVLNEELRVSLANRSFYDLFEVSPEETKGRLLYELGNGQWDIPELRRLLTELLQEKPEVTDYRVEHDFQQIGWRTMLLNARRMEHGRELILVAMEDITEREHARWELEAQKEFAEKIIDASREALLVLDRKLRVKTANETFYRTFKVNRDETVGRLVYELGNGQWDIPRLRELLETVLPQKDSFDDFEVNHRFENLGYREMLLNARKIDHKQWILLAIEDVTERERSMRALRESEERFRLIVESARNYAIFTTDREGRITGWYPGAENVFGWSEKEAVGRDAGFVFTVEDREKGVVSAELRGAEREGVAPDVRWHLHKGGRKVFIEGRVVALRDSGGMLRGFLKIGQDVTARKRTEQRLRESEERLKRALEAEAVGVLFFDDAGHLIGANETFLKMTGYARSEIESGTMTWRDITAPEWIDEVQREWTKLKGTGRLGPYEKELLHRDGSRCWALFSGRDLGDGTIVEYCFDISDRKEVEEQREFLLAELNHRVKNTLAVVQGLASQTIASSKSLEEFGTAFRGRLAALARTHNHLLRRDWKSSDLRNLTEEAVGTFGPDRVSLRGPALQVSSKIALSLNLVLHELETNAAKYGALSNERGHVEITWTGSETGRVQLVWQEKGGPPVKKPGREGFGTRLIRQIVEYDLGGAAELRFEPEGFRGELNFPANIT